MPPTRSKLPSNSNRKNKTDQPKSSKLKKDTRTTPLAIAPLSEMRPATLEKVEKAVRLLFADSDASDITMIQIAKTANVSLQTLYKYFGDKQTVLYTIMDLVLGRLATRMMDHLQGIDLSLIHISEPTRPY